MTEPIKVPLLMKASSLLWTSMNLSFLRVKQGSPCYLSATQISHQALAQTIALPLLFRSFG